MTQLAFQLSSKAPTQADKILDELDAQRGEWVEMFELYQSSGAMAVHSRINDLRQRGHSIDNKCERQPDGTRHSFYRLNW